MFRREMCAAKKGVEARRNGLAARREEQRNKLMQNLRKVETTEKKVVVPKPKEDASERRARLNQYREMKTRKETELKAERLKTPAFKIGSAPAKERAPASTARKMLDFDFRKKSSTESAVNSKTPAVRKALQFGKAPTNIALPAVKSSEPSNEQVQTKTAVKPDLKENFHPASQVRPGSRNPQTSTKRPVSTQRTTSVTPSANPNMTTPKPGLRMPTPSRNASKGPTPSKTSSVSASKRTPATTSKSNSKTVSTKSTPLKSASTPLRSVGLGSRTQPKKTPQPSPLAGSTRSNVSKQKADLRDTTNEKKKPNSTPKAPTTTPLKRTQSTSNLSRPTPLRSVTKPDQSSHSKTPQTATLKRAQSSNNLSRPNLLRSVAKPSECSQSKTPQVKLQRSTSASTLARKPLTSSSPVAKARSNLSKNLSGSSSNVERARDGGPPNALNTRSNSKLTSVPKPGPMSRIQAAVMKNQQTRADSQKQDPICGEDENLKKWTRLLALARAQQGS
ncbi:flocculation protein FLO11 [Galendromus occidentalis]|uniref:Flocculation protein FLO11 n=1 Tax=Galendromus occidentalis TaxID=34638 RepID=A0AAJ6QNW1_9ACAR|nr:flocculation protein FLO11 [Galendromus occidentalis]